LNNVIVKTEHLSKVYNGISNYAVAALTDINIEVTRGEILLIIGPNGSGKTTLLSLLGGLIKPNSGKIYIGNSDITALNEKNRTVFRLKDIGFIFQSFRLIDSLTVRENIELILNLSGKNRQISKKQTNFLLDEMDIAYRSNFYPDVLSGGEKQRVAIARALINDPEIILADEPTGSLDSQAGKAAIELLCKTARQRGKTVIIVSHDLRIQNYAHRVLQMEDGKIINGSIK
jgi:putative ABC transport system ATP-binding protein